IQPDDDHSAIAADDLIVSPGGAGDLATLARLQLDVVDDGADRHLADLHRIARLHVDLLAGDDLVARSETLRSDNVGLLAALVGDERDERRPVGVVFEPLHGRGNVPGAALEVDVAILLLVTAGDAARSFV